MTNEELLATAEVALIRASKAGKDCVDLQKAINTLSHCVENNQIDGIDFARAVLLTEIEELK
jgi:hypothetical protein